MNAPTEWPRWPNLRGQHHPQLDWVVTVYDADRIRLMADAAEQGEWNLWTKSAVEVLRALADSAPALKALNHRRPKIPNEVMGLNRATHYLLRLELRGEGHEGGARDDVAGTWHREIETVRRDVLDHGAHARALIEELLATLERLQHKPRAELIAAFDRDMEHRAAHMTGEN